MPALIPFRHQLVALYKQTDAHNILNSLPNLTSPLLRHSISTTPTLLNIRLMCKREGERWKYLLNKKIKENKIKFLI